MTVPSRIVRHRRMYATCLFCHARLGTNEAIEQFPVGRRLAFDAAKGRLWVVCLACGRWNLSPAEERWEAIETCERLFRATRVRVTTTHIGLAALKEGVDLVRIGAPLRPEFAAWRYGRRFTRRHTRAQIAAGTAVVAAGAGAVAFAPILVPAISFGAISIVIIPGLTTVLGTIPVVGALALRDYLQHDRIIGRLPLRAARPDAGGSVVTVRAKHARAAQLRVLGGEQSSVSLDVPHDSGWARFEGLEALQAAGTLMAGVNRFGAPASEIDEAVNRVEAHGDATTYLRAASSLGDARNSRMTSVLNLWRGLGALHLSNSECLALEMALHEESERRALDGELAILESAWKEAEEIAALADSL
jgi:hypothetical protein